MLACDLICLEEVTDHIEHFFRDDGLAARRSTVLGMKCLCEGVSGGNVLCSAKDATHVDDVDVPKTETNFDAEFNIL